jgi:hypothetical protein
MGRLVNADESELKVFSREYFDNMVGVVPYFMSMLLTSLPFSAVLPSVFCAIVYWMAGLRPEWEAFLWFLLIMTYPTPIPTPTPRRALTHDTHDTPRTTHGMNVG